MKKVFLTLALMVTTMVASAQFYVGGGIGYSKTKVGEAESTVFSISPEIGYKIDNNWSVGANLEFENTEDASKTFAIEPYIRYTVLKVGNFSVFADGAIGVGTLKPEGGENSTIWSIGVRPGIAYDINNKFTARAHIGWLGHTDLDSAGEATAIELSSKNIEFSIYYNF